MRKMPDLFIFLIGCVLPMFVLLFILLPMILRFALKPACALPPLPARAFGVQQHQRSRSLCTGKNLRVLRFCGFQLCA
jgi:hypothetical protein